MPAESSHRWSGREDSNLSSISFASFQLFPLVFTGPAIHAGPGLFLPRLKPLEICRNNLQSKEIGVHGGVHGAYCPVVSTHRLSPRLGTVSKGISCEARLWIHLTGLAGRGNYCFSSKLPDPCYPMPSMKKAMSITFARV
jgi:hypothetical protein